MKFIEITILLLHRILLTVLSNGLLAKKAREPLLSAEAGRNKMEAKL